ncbi:MAG: hypothetical protein PHQ43_14340 [Dehalococcoidales bacterium]|nr:hypothetical protein [Dehalococcoidales bacterium]
MSNGVKEPTTSYTVDEDGTTYKMVEYGPEDEYLLTKGGFEDPNYTQIPNQLLGHWKGGVYIVGQMADMRETELKVCLALCRETFGFHRDAAAASLSWLEKATGLSRQGVIDGINSLMKRGLFDKVGQSNKGTVFSKGSQQNRLGVVNGVDQTSQHSRHIKESIKKEERNGAQAPPLNEEEEDIEPTEIYYKDKTRVRAQGKVSEGPWVVVCDSCGNDVIIHELNSPTECRCVMRRYTLLSGRPQPKVKPGSAAVKAYYLITGLKSTEWEEDIAEAITDVPRWRRVVKEYIKQGWSPKSVGTMLKYYEENRMPGTKKEGEPAANDYGPDPMLMNMPGG